MTTPASATERRIRAVLPLVRWMQVYVPLSVVRWSERRSAARVRLPAGVNHEVVSAGGVRCEWIIPDAAAADQVLLYLHGGGFVYGISSLHRDMVAYLARQMGARALLVDYRLAPEHPFPAALDDCVTAYRWLLNQGVPPGNIAVAGDSAGGNLTLTALMKLRDDDLPLPAAAACLSPVADMTERAVRPDAIDDPVLPAKAIKGYREACIADGDPRDPLISPVFGHWHDLPPLLVHVGEDEILRDDAVRIERLASAAGVAARLETYPRMWHVWQLYLSLPQAVQSLDDVADFLKSHLRVASPRRSE